MDSEIETIEARSKSFLALLQSEYGVLDRMVYKNKNQHRRCSYFQYLLKVRSDLRLLQSTHLDEILNSAFLVINGNRAKQKVQLLESLKRRKCDRGNQNFLVRLQGAARLLSQMVEPMLKAATQISTLLAQSFFMGFCTTILALLARLRILVQQILLDVVSVFNLVSSLSCKQQSIKIAQEGFEVFREYYPSNERPVLLECVWGTDKFVLHERIPKPENEKLDMDKGEDVSQGVSVVQYQSIEALLGDHEFGNVVTNKTSEESTAKIEEDNRCSMEVSLVDCAQVEDVVEAKDGSGVSEPSSKNLLREDELLTSSSPFSNTSKLKSASRNKVAFISVKRPAPSAPKETRLQIKQTEIKRGDKEDPFFTLLTGGSLKDSLL